VRFLIYLAVFAIVLVAAHFIKKNRNGKWTELSARRGWQWTGDARPRIDERLPGGIFVLGSSHADEFVMNGVFDGLRITSGIYSYRTGAGRYSTTYSQRYVTTPAPQTPSLQLVHGTWWINRKATAIKFPDEEFNKRWNVTGDEGFARAVITPQVAQFLMAQGKNIGFIIGGGTVTSWVRGTTGRVDEERMDQACRQLCAFVHAIPESVKSAFPQGFPRPDGSGPAPLPGAPVPGAIGPGMPTPGQN